MPIADIGTVLYVVYKYLIALSFTGQPVSAINSSLHPWKMTIEIKLLLSKLKELFSKKNK